MTTKKKSNKKTKAKPQAKSDQKLCKTCKVKLTDNHQTYCPKCSAERRKKQNKIAYKKHIEKFGRFRITPKQAAVQQALLKQPSVKKVTEKIETVTVAGQAVEVVT
ncbi:zinc-ribbon domain protein [Caudoviricetes sp.]|nr:zinc-ribbon domain protein [Caudoviricetes sp.]